MSQVCDRVGGQGRIHAADRQREIAADLRIVLRRLEGVDQLGTERPVGANLWIGHQTRELVCGGPAPIGATVADLGKILARRTAVGEQGTEPDVHTDRDRDNDQRNQEKLNGEGGRGDQRVTSRGFALDEFVHLDRNKGMCPGNSRDTLVGFITSSGSFASAGRFQPGFH